MHVFRKGRTVQYPSIKKAPLPGNITPVVDKIEEIQIFQIDVSLVKKIFVIPLAGLIQNCVSYFLKFSIWIFDMTGQI